MKRIPKTDRSTTDKIDKPKYCVYCGNLVTQEGFFDTGNGVIAIEKYCHLCNGRANLRLRAPSLHYDMMN